MEIILTLDLSNEELAQLAAILRCEPAEVPTQLEHLGGAALTEYLELVLGRRVFTRGSDMREYRLFLLIQRLYGGQRLPTEDEVSALFQTTSTQSRSLLRAVGSKYQYELSEITQAALRAAVDLISQADGAAAGADWHLEGTASRYVVKPSTRLALRDAFGLQ
jgi:hypothetical protein